MIKPSKHDAVLSNHFTVHFRSTYPEAGDKSSVFAFRYNAFIIDDRLSILATVLGKKLIFTDIALSCRWDRFIFNWA